MTGITAKKSKTATKKKAAGKVSRQTPKDKYVALLSNLELAHIMVERELIERDIEQEPEKIDVNIERRPEALLAKDKHSFRIRDNIMITGTNKGQERPLFRMEFQLTLEYRSKDTITKSFVDTFGESNFDMHSWPYVRELVHSATFRMNLPPLILPLNIINRKSFDE
jgi:preprotein translocase subunit SecB